MDKMGKESWDCWAPRGIPQPEQHSEFCMTKWTALTWNQSCNLVTDWWWYQFASALGYEMGALSCNLWSLTHGEDSSHNCDSRYAVTWDFPVLEISQVWMLTSTQVWVLVKAQFCDVSSTLSISIFFFFKFLFSFKVGVFNANMLKVS